MPRYDFACAACGWSGDLIVPVESRHSQVCPSCGLGLRKLLSAPSSRPIIDSRARARKAADQGLTEIGGNSLDSVNRDFAQQERYRDEANEREIRHEVDDWLSTDGGELYANP